MYAPVAMLPPTAQTAYRHTRSEHIQDRLKSVEETHQSLAACERAHGGGVAGSKEWLFVYLRDRKRMKCVKVYVEMRLASVAVYVASCRRSKPRRRATLHQKPNDVILSRAAT